MRAFWESGEAERFGLSGTGGDHVDYLQRHDGADAAPRGVQATAATCTASAWISSRPSCGDTRQLVESIESRDLRRGFTLTLLLLLGAAWLISLAPLIYIAHRISRPIQAAHRRADRLCGG